MNTFLWFFLGIFMASCSFQSNDPTGKMNLFRHHTVSTDFPDRYDMRYGMPAMADFDNDGDLDFALSRTRDEVYWFEFEGDFKWKKHKLGDIPTAQLAGAAYDVDRDGWQDLVTGGYWYRNTGDPKKEEFIRIQYDSAIDREIHDMVFQDINGDGNMDLVAMGDNEGCFWYDIPEDPLDMPIWTKHLITLEVLDENTDIHGGFFPGGVGDVDMDGDADIVLVGRWLKNEGQGKTWTKHLLPYGSAGYWGLSGRSWIVDMDKDGDNDIVMVSCDQKDSRGAWLENNGKEVPSFTVHLLPLSASGRRGSFHSLWVADFDMDGDMDIYTMDQEDEVILPEGAPTRAYLWENIDGSGKNFVEKIVLDKKIGGHDVKFGDVDGDGDLDAYFKVWANYKNNGYNGLPHADYLENLTIK